MKRVRAIAAYLDDDDDSRTPRAGRGVRRAKRRRLRIRRFRSPERR